MLDIHLTSDDIARVTVVPTYGPLSEIIFSLVVLRDRHNRFRYSAWAQHLDPAVRRAGQLLIGLVSCPPPIDLITLSSPLTSLNAGIEAILKAPAAAMRAEIESVGPRLTTAPPGWIGDLPGNLSVRRGLGRGLAGYYDSAIAPHWSRFLALLDAQAVAYARQLANGGVHAFLHTLHPDLRWSPPVLTLSRPAPPEVLKAHGRGLVIVPVVFAQRVGVFYSVVRPEEPIVVTVPALRSIADTQAIWGAGGLAASRALAALLGETRAAALDAISESCTTSELARRLAVSPATASHHATVLRSAGLIMTRRLGSAVLHTVTPLGTQLLDGHSISD